MRRAAWTASLAFQVRGQARYPFRPLERIAADRDAAARRMVSHAYRHVPHYRTVMDGLGLGPSDFRHAADLARLPLLDAATIQAAPDALVAADVDPGRCLVLRTSGTSGTPRSIPVDDAALFRNAAQGERERGMMAKAVGKRLGYREVVIVLDPRLEESSTPKVQRFLRANAFLPRGMAIERMYVDAATPPAAYLPAVERYRPDVVQGYGSSIDELVSHLIASGSVVHRPRAIYYHSDGVSSFTRETLASWGIPVFSTYEACEALKIGFECDAHEGYHVNIDTYPLRIVDDADADVKPGGAGRVVVSNLSNRAMVLLNYDLGDRARWLEAPCPCGRTLPRLVLEEESPYESIRLPSGRVVTPSALYGVFLGESALREHQLVQVSPIRFRILLVVPDPSARAAMATRIEHAFRTVVADEAEVEVVAVDRIPPGAGGKRRRFVPLGRP